MPTLWAHGLYFNNSSTAVAPTIAASEGGYPRWQASNIAIGSLFGGLQIGWERLKWWGSVIRRIWRLPIWLRGELDRRIDTLVAPVVVAQAVGPPIRRRSFIEWLAHPRLKCVPAAPVEAPALLTRTAVLLAHPAYPMAQVAVRKTATTLGFNRPEAWQGLSRQMKASPGYAENIYRHMQACQWTKAEAPSTLSNPDCNLLVELAYHEFGMRGE